MITTPTKPFNIETQYEIGIINSLNDPVGQQRCRISTASLAQVGPDQLPWARCVSSHSQETGQQGGTMESMHTFKVGDKVLIYRPTAADQHWVIAGHPGTIQQQGGQGGGG